MGSIGPYTVNALIVGWLAGNGIMLVVGVLLFTAADSWAGWQRRRALRRAYRTMLSRMPDPIRPSQRVPDAALDPSARAAVSEIRQKERAP